MASPIAIAAALSRIVKITCPNCGHVKAVSAQRKTHRVCPRCHKRFPDPLSSPRKRR